MAFGIDDVALSAMKESAREALEQTCQEIESGVEAAGQKSETPKSSFNSSDFGKANMRSSENLDSHQFDNLGNSPDAVQVEAAFQPKNFDGIVKEDIEQGGSVSELDETPNTTVTTEREVLKSSTESPIAAPHHISNISFGNMYDDRAVDFLKECQRCNIDLPISVTHAGTGIDRSCDGGLLSIDKGLIETALKSALEKGKITKDVYERLHSKLMSC